MHHPACGSNSPSSLTMLIDGRDPDREPIRNVVQDSGPTVFLQAPRTASRQRIVRDLITTAVSAITGRFPHPIPYLMAEDAGSLMTRIVNQYRQYVHQALAEVVMHKTSRTSPLSSAMRITI